MLNSTAVSAYLSFNRNVRNRADSLDVGILINTTAAHADQLLILGDVNRAEIAGCLTIRAVTVENSDHSCSSVQVLWLASIMIFMVLCLAIPNSFTKL